MEKLFYIDDVGYDVHLMKLTRKFAVLDTERSGRTMDGKMYREPVGTFYNYSITVAPRSGKGEELEAFWQVISKPCKSHLCRFPYGQKTLTQEMYITGGEQDLIHAGKDRVWGEISINFIAMEPRVTP